MAQKEISKNPVESEVAGLFSENPDRLRDLVREICQQIIEAEMTEHLGAEWHERTPDRKGSRNGYKGRSLHTRVGSIDIQVPQARDSSFSSRLFDRYQRSEKALCLALMESYIQGVSTRRMKKITRQLCGTEFSATTISNLTKTLDEELEKFRNRDLSGRRYKYLVIDARYEKVRQNSVVVDQAVLIVSGITEDHYREILAVEIANLESEATWGRIFSNLKKRNIEGVEYIVSDAHEGIRQAVKKHFTGCLWQRCQVHYIRNIMKLVKLKDRKALAKALEFIWDSETTDEARKKAGKVISFYEKNNPEVADKIESDIEETFTVFALPASHRRRMKSTNMLERLSGSISQRTRVVRIFPDRASCLRLITAVLKEIHEDWISSRRYLPVVEEDGKSVKEEGIELPFLKEMAIV